MSETTEPRGHRYSVIYAEWLADKLHNGGDYGKEAAALLVTHAKEVERLNRLVGAVRESFNRECDDADAILRALGFEPENARTEGGPLKLQMVLGAMEHRDVMLKRAAMEHMNRADDCGRLARMVLESAADGSQHV